MHEEREIIDKELCADSTDFADSLKISLDPIVYNALVRMYDRCAYVLREPDSFEHFVGTIIVGGIVQYGIQLERKEKRLKSINKFS